MIKSNFTALILSKQSKNITNLHKKFKKIIKKRIRTFIKQVPILYRVYNLYYGFIIEIVVLYFGQIWMCKTCIT